MKITYVMLSFFTFFLFLSLAGSAHAAVMEVSVGTDSIVYKPGDNVTVSGVVRNAATRQPIQGATAVIAVRKGGSTVTSQSKSSDIDGKYESDPFIVSSAGTYSVSVTATHPSHTSNSVVGSFTVESEKRYTLTTDRYTYSVNDTVTTTLLVESVTATGTTPASSITVPVKLKLINGTVVKKQTVTTNSNGLATLTYQVQDYGDYLIVAGNGLAMTAFEVPSFDIRVSIIGDDEKKKYLFGSGDSLYARVTATTIGSTGSSWPVKNANIEAYIKGSDGNTIYTFKNSTENPDGVYSTETKSLGSFANGKYYLEVEVTKGSSTMKKKVWFEIRSLRVDLVPMGEMEHIMSFLKGQDVRLGLFIINMQTGDQLAGDEIYGADVVGCRDEKGKDCLTKLTGNLNQTEAGFMEFSKILRFTAPNEIGEFFISVEVDTSAGLGRGETSIFVQNVIAYTETKDQFGMWRWRYGSGENVSLDVKAFTGNYTPTSVTRVEILEIRNESWGDITSQVIPNTSNRVSNGNQISFSAPQSSGWYNVKLKVNTTSGEGYVGAGFNVRLYDIWVDLMDGPYANNSWKWRFGSQNDVYFHINVYNLGGYEEDNMIDSSNYRLSFVKLRNEMTHREYANLNVTKYQEISDDDWGRPVFRLSLANLGLESGFYMTEFELTDLDGNKDSGEAWFKISNLDIWISTQTETGESKWRFEPTSNITFSVTAKYFNGTDVPDGSNVSIESVMYAQKGPPMPIPSDVYNKSGTVQTSSGNAKTWIKANPGKSLAQGHYMTLIKVVIPDGTQEIQEAWFEVSAVDVYGWSEPWIVSQSQNVTMKITAKKMDGSPVNATLTLVELRDTMTWTEVDRSLYDYGLSKNATGAQVTTNFNFSVANLPTGQYEAVIRVNAYDLGATSDAYVWFSVQNYQISGELADPSKRVYAPEENVEMWITVRDPNGAGLSNENVTIYQFANTESWPWSFTAATMIGQPSPTDSNGRTKVRFKAPKDAGMYRPMTNISGELQKDPWQLPDFGVRSAAVNVRLLDESGTERDDFAAEAKVQVEINISNPTGGEISVSQIKLKYKKLDTNQETDLQTITTGIDENNYVNFTAPDSQGEYVLFVSVTDSTTGNIIIAKRWFRVRTFDLKIWTEKWAHDSGQNVTINIDARNPDGSQANITVRLQDLNDMWTWATPTDYNVVANPTNISGAGEYNVSTQNLSLGEYDVVLCIYIQGGPPGSQCEYGQRFYLGFSIQSFDVHAYIDKGSFTTQDTIELFLEVELSNGTFVNSDSYTANFIDLRDLRTWSNVSSNLTSSISIENQTSPKRKKINFTANLVPGEYMASFNVTYQGESRIREIWFKMSDYEMTLDSIPSCTQDCKFFASQTITFNLSLSPAPSENISGKLILMDDYRWIKISEESITIGTNGFVLHNLTISDSGRYTLRAEVGTAERFFWFEVGAYDIQILHWMSDHDVRPIDNISVYFNIYHPNGTEYTGNMSVIVKEIRNAWDWSPVGGSNLNETNISAQAGNELYKFTPYLGSGEYEAILRFKAKGKNTIKHYHFNVRTKEFWAWPEGCPYMPGENVTIKAVLKYPNGTPQQNVNISIEEIYYQKEDKSVMNDVNFITKYADTGSDGVVTLKFVSLPNATGKFDVRLMERKDNETTWMGFDVNTYELRIDKTDDKWVYLPDEYFTRRLYVFKSGTPQQGIDIGVRVWKQGQWGEGQNISYYSIGQTDSSGYVYINFTVPNETSHYEAEIIAEDGAATYWEHFQVATFFVDAWTRGESSESDRVSVGEDVIVNVYAKDPNGNKIANANVSIFEFRNLMGWQFVPNVSIIKNDQVTDSSGKAELRFVAPNQSGEYVARINVTANVSGIVSSTEREAWFKVTDFSFTLEFVCPPGAPSSCRADETNPSIQMIALLNVTGNITNINLCLEKTRDIYTGTENFQNICNSSSNGTLYLGFPAPVQTSEYDAVFRIQIQGNATYDEFEEWRWFRVEESTGYSDVHTFVEPHDAWAGKNATVYIELWGSNWQDIDEESECNFTIVEIRDAMNWEYGNTSIQQWGLGSGGGPGPPGYRLVFTVPWFFDYGEYEARINFSCKQGTFNRNVHFSAIAFQASLLMGESLDANITEKFWIKITDANGTPVVNADVYKSKLINDWEWEVVEEYSESPMKTNSYGEVTGNFTTPFYPAEYILRLKVVNGSVEQNIDRWFNIQMVNAKIDLGSGDNKFFVNETVNITINATDSSTGQPVVNTSVDVYVHKMMMGPESGPGPPVPGNDTGPAYVGNGITDSNGTVTFILNDTVTQNAGEYEIDAKVRLSEGGDGFARVLFTIRNFNLTATTNNMEYGLGENITVNVTALNASGQPLPAGTIVGVVLVPVEFKGEEGGGENVTIMASVNLSLDTSGEASGNLTIPMNASSGPAVMIIIMEYNNTKDEDEYLIIIKGAGSETNVTILDSGPFSSRQLVNVSIKTNASQNLAMAPFVQHLKKTGTAIPMSEIMGGGPESGKEDYYKSSIYTNSTGDAHIMILTQPKSGNYTALIPFFYKNQQFFEEPVDMAFVDYSVV